DAATVMIAGGRPALRSPGAGGPVFLGPGASTRARAARKAWKRWRQRRPCLSRKFWGSGNQNPNCYACCTPVPTVPMVEMMQFPAVPRPTYQQVQQTLQTWAATVATMVPPMVHLAPMTGFNWTVQRLEKPCSCHEQLSLSSSSPPRATESTFCSLLCSRQSSPHGPAAPSPGPQEPAAYRELGVSLGLILEEKEEAVLVAAAGLEEARVLVAISECLGEDKKKGKPEKLTQHSHRQLRAAGRTSACWSGMQMVSESSAKGICDKCTGKIIGYSFFSFKDPSNYVRSLRKSTWKARKLGLECKKQKKLGLR
ncbi:hypothetical protein EI555_006603, partial [Monodon monoceros]